MPLTVLPKKKTKRIIDVTSVFQFTVDQYHRLINADVLSPNDRCELIRGFIVKKMSQNPPHSTGITYVNKRLVRSLPDEWTVRVQCPITLAHSEPEPDIAVVRGPEKLWIHRHPGPADIEALMEIADSSVLSDRRDKGLLYAEANIREFWLVNLVSKKLEVYTRPKPGKVPKYGHVREYKKNDVVTLTLTDGTILQVPVAGFFPE